MFSFARAQVMVMTAGTSRLRKTEAAEADQANPSKELNDEFNDIKLAGVGGDFEELTNDQGDVFYRPTLTISSKLSSTFGGKMFNETIRTWFPFSLVVGGSLPVLGSEKNLNLLKARKFMICPRKKAWKRNKQKSTVKKWTYFHTTAHTKHLNTWTWTVE